MIEFHYLIDIELVRSDRYTKWLYNLADNEGKKIGDLSFVFTDDHYLLELNKKYLNHDFYTDILTFDNSSGITINGDVFISVDRVRENASQFNQPFERELARVMAHGLLHMMGYDDKNAASRKIMKDKEDYAINMFHVEH